MVFRFFKNKEIEDFAQSMAEHFAKRCPPNLQDDESPATTHQRDAAMHTIYSELGGFRKRVRLGVFRKALLANTLKWELKERGYKSAFVNAMVYDMLVSLAGSKKK
ncbi:MAG: hypothetical protein AABZ80_12550 [Gemmatimonadota bacterium]